MVCIKKETSLREQIVTTMMKLCENEMRKVTDRIVLHHTVVPLINIDQH